MAGGDTVTFTNVTSTFVGTFFVQGRGSVGSSTTVTAQAPGYNDDTLPVTLQPSGFVFDSPGNFATTTFAANTTLFIGSVRLTPGTLTVAANQPVRGGLTVDVAVTSATPSVGVITTSPLTFVAGDGQVTTAFDPLNAGSSLLTVEVPPGFSPPTNFRQITATVNP